MKKITRRQFLLGSAPVILAGMHIFSNAERLAYPSPEKPGSKILEPIECDLIIEKSFYF